MAGLVRIFTGPYKYFRLNYDADDAFSYRTVKRVIIRDSALGITHSALTFLVFLYAFGTIVLERRFLTSVGVQVSPRAK